VHHDFFRAGADVATTATYQASFAGLAGVGLDDRTTTALLRRGVELARDAAAEAAADDGRPRLVAASVGPYGAALADGSEYSGDYGVDDATLRAFHGRRLEVLADAGADLLALETIPSEQEAVVLLGLLADLASPVPAWLSITCRDGARTRRGDPVSATYAAAGDVESVVAVGANCVAPEHAVELVDAAVAASGGPAVIYPNTGESWDALGRRWQRDATFDAAAVGDWVARGARFVGGCCRVTVADIASVAEAVGGAA
jgi:homocysteine S-methyltransferase